jgi:HKD family nuclease
MKRFNLGLGFLAVFISIAAGNFLPAYPATVEAFDISNRVYLDTTIREINNAKSTIKAAMYCAYVHKGEEKGGVYKLLQALIDARVRGVDVEVYLDATYGNAKSNQDGAKMLLDGGVKVFFVSDKKMHAKLIVIDHEVIIEGSSNWTQKAFSDNWEANTLMRSRELAREKEKFFTAFKTTPIEIDSNINVSMDFLPHAGLMVRRNDGRAFDLYMWLLKNKATDFVVIDYVKTANELGVRIDGIKGGYRRAVRAAAITLKERYGLIDYVLDKDFNLKLRLIPQVGESFAFPVSYWESGMVSELSLCEKVFCLIGYAQAQAARPNIYWTRSMDWLAKTYGIYRSTLSRAAMGLKHRCILEIDFARAIGADFKNKEASKYRMKGFASQVEREEMFNELEGGFNVPLVGQARELAVMIDEDNNIDTVREFITLIQSYSYERVRKATEKIARYKPQNPLRNVRFIAGVVKQEP